MYYICTFMIEITEKYDQEICTVQVVHVLISSLFVINHNCPQRKRMWIYDTSCVKVDYIINALRKFKVQ